MLIRGVVKCSARNCPGVTGKLTSPVCGTPEPIFLRVFGIPHGIPSGILESIPHGIPSGNLASTNCKHVRLSNVELYVYLTLCSHVRQTANMCVCPPSSCKFILRCAVSSLEERLATPIIYCYCRLRRYGTTSPSREHRCCTQGYHRR